MQLKNILDKRYPQKNGIWLCISQARDQTSYQQNYDVMHSQPFSTIYDGSYEILGQFARGNTTLDIACGDGYLTSLSPNTTVGLDFSLNALKKAKDHGAKHLVLANAHKLPFKDLSFDLSICSGSLEHFNDPLLALKEMKRVSTTQILITHRPYPIPLGDHLRPLVIKLFNMPDQPNDHPLSIKRLRNLCKKAGLNIVYEGVWTYPFDLQVLSSFIPRQFYLPSCTFIVSTYPPHALHR